MAERAARLSVARPDLPEGFRWEDPASVREYDQLNIDPKVLGLLRANPGTWARIKFYRSKKGASGAGQNIRRSKSQLGKGWDATGRQGDGGSWLYLRWIGDGDMTDGGGV